MPYDAPVEPRVKAHTSPIAFQPWDYIYTHSLSHSHRGYGKQPNAATHYASYQVRTLVPSAPATGNEHWYPLHQLPEGCHPL